MNTNTNLTRRTFFANSALAGLGIGSAGIATSAAAQDGPYDQMGGSMTFEVTRTDKEWRNMLTEFEYSILREGGTEDPKTSPLWAETADGTYVCKGCNLPTYTSDQKVVLNKGWVFFYNSEPDSVLMSIDRDIPPEYAAATGIDSVVELHCRRCASHLGHFLVIDGKMTHCINGTSLMFERTTT